MDFVIFALSMSALVFGAELIVMESEKIALHFRISHFVIGATLVAFGTSLPELAASVTASFAHKNEMAVANVVGSVIFNITMILGVVFLISDKTDSKRDLFSLDSAWVILPVVIFFAMSQDGEIGRVDGALFILLMVSYIVFLFGSSRRNLKGDIDETLIKAEFSWRKTALLLTAGFVLTIGGANFVVESGANIARTFGVSEWIIGIFLIAFGTSLPELVVSVMAMKKGNAEMSIGNVIGSNVANFSMVLGSAALVYPLGVDLEATRFDMLIMAAASISLVFILANSLYNRAGAVFLFILLALLVQNSF